MRLFIGIKTGCEGHLAALQEDLKKHGQGRFTDAANLHITLKFLGEAPPSAVIGICNALDNINAQPLRLECRGAHIFNKNGIVSAEIGGDTSRLAALSAKVEDAMEPLGLEHDPTLRCNSRRRTSAPSRMR